MLRRYGQTGTGKTYTMEVRRPTRSPAWPEQGREGCSLPPILRRARAHSLRGALQQKGEQGRAASRGWLEWRRTRALCGPRAQPG